MANTKYCIPKYCDSYIDFDGTIITTKQIEDYLIKDLLTYPEIATIIGEQSGYVVGKSTIQKIVKYYNIILSDEIKLARKQRSIKNQSERLQEKYGVSNVFQLQEIKDKASNTKLERYGDANYVNRKKMQQTCLERYGSENYSSTEDWQRKVEATNLKKFGTKAPAQSKQVLDKMKQTCLERYGVENYWSSDEFRKWQQEKYFEDYPELSDIYKDNYKDRVKLANVIKNLEDKTIMGLSKEFGISYASTRVLLNRLDLLDLVETRPNNSSYEIDIVNYVGSDLCILGDREQLGGKEIDIYIPSKKVGIEFNGTYWHSNLYKDKNFHIEKSKLAAEKGIRLIHIYEYEWANPEQQAKIKTMLDVAIGKAANKIYARNCSVHKISNAEALPLNRAAHLQNHRDAQVTYGLFFNDELVQLMSFSKAKCNKTLKTNNSWEIIRICSNSDTVVVGGVSKLFKAFVHEHDPDFVLSYCDFNKFDGSSYEAIGMQFIGYTEPDMKWVIDNHKIVNRKPRKHTDLKEISLTQIHGAGSKKYLWSKCS